MKWNKVSKSKPKYDGFYIIYEPPLQEDIDQLLDEKDYQKTLYDCVMAAFYRLSTDTFYLPDTDGLVNFAPTHWMDMPNPPE